MPHFKQRPKVTIEDLIRLKRDERPAAEFWVNFDHELRQKQLTALLEKRAWWQELPQLFMRRAYLPVGATAILAFTFVGKILWTNPGRCAGSAKSGRRRTGGRQSSGGFAAR